MAKAGIAALIVLLIGAVVTMVVALSHFSGDAMPASGVAAMWLGVVFSLLIGCGLMALVFYSSRKGYDEPARFDRDS
jgi:Na+-driven multidrug efflux pump